MTLANWWEWLESSWLAAQVRGDTTGFEWTFPILETLHVFALTVVFGSIAMVDLRLLGLAGRRTPISRLAEELLPWTWAAWCSAACFGTLMFISKAHTYAGNIPFRMKFLFMFLAALNMLVFQFGAFRNVSHWDLTEPPTAAKLAGALSLSCWLGVIVCGRWTGFTT